MYFTSDPQALHVTRNVIPGKLGVDLHLHRVHIPLVATYFRLVYLPCPFLGFILYFIFSSLYFPPLPQPLLLVNKDLYKHRMTWSRLITCVAGRRCRRTIMLVWEMTVGAVTWHAGGRRKLTGRTHRRKLRRRTTPPDAPRPFR